MSRLRLYLDEDAMQHGLVIALRARRIDIVTAAEAGMINKSDEDHLDRAAALTHAGIVLAPQQRYSVGEQLRRLLDLLNKKTAVEMQSRVEHLSAWGR
jgi:hypothetical protein